MGSPLQSWPYPHSPINLSTQICPPMSRGAGDHAWFLVQSLLPGAGVTGLMGPGMMTEGRQGRWRWLTQLEADLVTGACLLLLLALALLHVALQALLLLGALRRHQLLRRPPLVRLPHLLQLALLFLQ